jgi:PAS domain S-box-containing protein
MSHRHRRFADPPSMADYSSAGWARRQQAEALFLEKSAPASERRQALSLEDTRLMLHELHVHQIELEMQNEELRQAQLALDTERARYFDLYDLAPVGYCTLSHAGLIRQANLTAARLLGESRARLVKQPISRFIAKADQDVYYLHRKRVLETGEPQACELRMVKADGTPFWAHLASTAAPEADGAGELRLMLSDVSERKRAEAERATLAQVLQEQNAELARARRVAEIANRAKSEFLSRMSHDLRTPLSAILGFAQLIESGSPPPTPSQARSIAQILKAGWYLLGLINEVLDLALIDSGKLLLAVEAVSLPELISECRDLVEPLAMERGVSVSLPGFDMACRVQADRQRLQQILINLLSNAIKYNQAGGTVAVECRLRVPEALRISVRDSGPGLAPAQLAQLFEPFNRLGQEAGGEEGTGIGLVVCKRLVELMGGVIGVDSRVGQGSSFWIELCPAAIAPAAAGAAAAATVVQNPLDEGSSPRTLLYVEDNPANLMLVEEVVARRSDLRLLSARDGQGGVDLARACRPEVILMDISLPDISGVEALKMLAGDPATAHIPVIALSANAMPCDIENGLRAGFFRYLTKPIRIDEFSAALEFALEFARGARPHGRSHRDAARGRR